MKITLLLFLSTLNLLSSPGSCDETSFLDRYQNNAQQLIERIKNKISLSGKPTKQQ